MNKDYTISIDSDDSSGVTYFDVGTNEIKWKGKSLTYEVKEVETIFSGLCPTIWPKDVLLEPGDRYTISVHSNLTLKGCKLFSLEYCPRLNHFILLREGGSSCSDYSKVSIIRPGCSMLQEFEKNSTGHLIETFSKYPDQEV